MPIAAKQYNPEKGKAEYYEWVAKYHAANQKKEIVYPPIWEGEDDDEEEEEEEKEIKKETKKSDQNKKRKREENNHNHNQNDKDDGNDNQMNQKDDKKMKTINKGRTSGRTTRASSRFKSE